MANVKQSNDVQALLSAAIEMREAELQRDGTVLSRILDDNLRFRRAGGQVVDKEQYLKDLQDSGNSYECLESDVESVTVYENLAIVGLVVRARGMRKGEPYQGTYRNMRLFIKNPGEGEDAWRCAMWLNTKIGDASC